MRDAQINKKRFSVKNILAEVFDYAGQNCKSFVGASGINFVFLAIFAAFIKTTSSNLFLPWLGAYYAFWFAFFRAYYDRKPILFTKQIFGTLAPSTKILFIVFSLTLLVILLPFLPLFMGYNEEYAFFIDKYMSSMQTLGQEKYGANTNVLPLVILYSILLLLFPIIFIRPMFAWISSLIGRSGSIRNAFNHTQGNYIKFLVLTLIFELPIFLIEIVFEKYQINEALMWFITSPLIVLGNVSIAKSYDFFFLKSDNG